MGRKEVYIAGLSCRFPESQSPNEFFQNLISKKDMVTSDPRRWEEIEDIPNRFGKIKQDLAHFDHKFFSVHGKQTEKMDPQLRLLLEVSYEALADAGICLDDLKGSNTGVYIGACGSDSHKAWMQDRDAISGYEHTGCAVSMLSNRLSFFYDLQGPSETIDTACSSSLVAFHRAMTDLEAGVSEIAIVGGSNIILWPSMTHAFNKLKMLSPDGACKSFDQSANGFARAEGVAIVILTRGKKSPYTPYARVLGSSTNNGGWNPSGITVPSGKMQKKLYREVCESAGIEPKQIDYVEAHGTGTVVGDGEELEAIYEVYGKENPELIVGSVKSNMGHCEGASGLAGLIKTLLCFEHETIPPNLHLNDPNEKLKTMKVMTEPHLNWKGSRAAISSFGFGGTNAHVILEKCKDELISPQKNALGLTMLSHRTKKGLLELKHALKGKDRLPKLPNLTDRQKFPFREILELPDDPEVANISDTENQIYIACSGNGSQWKGMGLDLAKEFPSFKISIERCSRAIGTDINHILQKGPESALEATVSLVAFQIGLIEVLQSFGLGKKIKGFLGHSAGEIVCSYLDKITDLEETMRIAFARGFISNETGKIGLMASLGLPAEKAEQLIQECGCQDRVVIACYNSPNNVTISGTKEHVEQIVERCEKLDLFSRTLETFGVAYHSPILALKKIELARLLSEKMSSEKKQRSNDWHSSIHGLQLEAFDPNYHVEAMLKPVDFVSAIQKLPLKAVVVELGPHCILKNLIRDNRPDLKYVALTKKNQNEIVMLKEGIGQLWKMGIDVDFDEKASGMIGRPPIAVREKYVSWDHRDLFPIPKAEDFEASIGKEAKSSFDLSEKDRFIEGHAIDGKILLPATSYLCALWDKFRKDHRFKISDSINYLITNFEILQAVQVENNSKIDLSVTRTGNSYELHFKDEVIARAEITTVANKTWKSNQPRNCEKGACIDKENFYRIVRSVGYEYEGEFQPIQKLYSDFDANTNFVYLDRSSQNWISILDGSLQAQLLAPRSELKELRVPTRIQSIIINPKVFLDAPDPFVAAADFDMRTVILPGLEVENMETKVLKRSKKDFRNRAEIKQAAGLVFIGENLIVDKAYTNYAVFVTNYCIQLCTRLIEKYNLNETGHYKRILKSFQKWKFFSPVTEEQVDFYRKKPECIAVRILEDCYNRDKEFLEKPLVLTTQHPEHNQFYFVDPTASLHDKTSLPKFLSIVRDNSDKQDLNLLEIGTGTGGFTSLIAPYLLNDHYLATDITETPQMGKIENFYPEYEKFNLNDYEAYNIFRRHDVDLVIASNSLHTANDLERSLKSIQTNLKEGGFILFYEFNAPLALSLWGMEKRLWDFVDERQYGLWTTIDSWKEKIAKAGLELVSYFTDASQVSSLFLVRKPKPLKMKKMASPAIEGFSNWAESIKAVDEPTLIVSEKSEDSGAIGFARSMNKEVESAPFYALISKDKVNPSTLAEVEKIGLRFNVWENDRLATVCYSDIQGKPEEKNTGFSIQFPTLGDFSDYEWHQNREMKNENRYITKYAALNFKDIMLISGKVSKDAFSGFSKNGYIGVEFSGMGTDGKKYMGLTKGLSTKVEPLNDMIMPVPDWMSLEEAATIPVVYGTAYYALFDRANLQAGQAVLIHAAAGGVGQAAIRVCLSLKCKVFVTCHQSKRALVKELFPELDDEAILDSRSTEFERQILKMTNGKGVNVVLNSLADEKLQASIRVLCREGQFLEIGKYDIMKHAPLDMHILIKNTTIHGVDLDQLLIYPERTKKLFDRVQQGLKDGIIKPLPRHIFPHSELDEALRFMAAGKHIGKVLIDMEGMDQNTSPGKFKYPFFCSEQEDEKVYLITGGLGGFGLSLMKWLFDRGVKRFIVTSRKGVTNGEQKRVLNLLKNQGAEVTVSTLDVSNPKETEELIRLANGKLGAVFHLAMVLEDGLFKNMTQEKWEKTVHVKAKGVLHLDRLTRHPSVKYFVAFSSVATRYGNIGQTNYTFGNSLMEEVCRQRKNEGFHALAIQWGIIDHVGFVSKNRDTVKHLETQIEAIHIEDALQFIDDALSKKLDSHCLEYTAQVIRQRKIQDATVTVEEVLAQISNVIKTDLSRCNASDTLEFLGIDSLQVVEIQTILIKSFQEVLPLKKISSMKVGELKELIGSKLGLKELGPTQRSEPAGEVNALLNPIYQKGREEVVFVFLGLGVDPKTIQFPEPNRFDLCIVNWQEASAIEAIATDIKEYSKGKKVRFLTHSAGYQIAKAIQSLNQFPLEKVVAVSLLSEDLIKNVVDFDQLDRIPDEVFEKGYQSAAFYVENHLPISKVKHQIFLVEKAIQLKALPPHLILYPKNDPICLKEGVAIEGTHKIETFLMEEIYANL